MQPIILVTNEEKQLSKFLEKNFSKEYIIVSLFPEKTEYSINQIRFIQKEVKYFNPKKRAYIFFEFHRSSKEAQNAFLKLLEEPPINVIFIMVTASLYFLLPTIISRAKIINLRTEQKANIDKNIKKTIEKIKKGYLRFIRVDDRNKAKDIILSIIYFFKNRLLEDTKSYLILKQLLKNLSLLEKNNLNPQITLDNLLIFIYKCYNENNNG